MLSDDQQEMMTKMAEDTMATVKQTLKDNPQLLVPLALIHTVPVVIGLAACASLLQGHQRLNLEKERTKQIRLRAELAEKQHGCGHGKHHHGPHAHNHFEKPRYLVENDAQ